MRPYEWSLYAFAAGAGALWGGSSIEVMFGFSQSGPVTWFLLWPAWVDLALLRNPGMLPACLVGGVGCCLVTWALMTVGHVRSRP